jgi:protein-tyrosine-phosphatase
VLSENRVLNVLFLCTGNSARSIIAECVLNGLGRTRFKGFSAGSMPAGEVHPSALQLLRNANLDVAALRSKSWDEFAQPGAPPLDFVLTVCDNAAAEVCPVWPGQPITAHWGLPDPAAVVGSQAEIELAFADTYRAMTNRIDSFIHLPLASLDKMALQKELTQIGASEQPTDEAPS